MLPGPLVTVVLRNIRTADGTLIGAERRQATPTLGRRQKSDLRGATAGDADLRTEAE
jgi:hypothetical protein